MTEDRESFGTGLIEALEEVAAWKRGATAVQTVNVEPMPAARIRAIRRKVAKSAREFEARFGIPASTLSNWEQGRRVPDPAARVLLKVIEEDPEVAERAARRP